MKKDTLRAVFSIIVSVLLSLCLLWGLAGLTVRLTLCEPALLHRAIASSRFAEKAKEDVVTKWEDLFSACGLEDTATLTELLKEDDTQGRITAYIDGAYQGKTVFNTADLAQGLEARIRELVPLGENVTEEERQEFETNTADLVGACTDAYTESVRIRLLPSVLSFLGGLSGKLTVTSVGALVFAAALGGFLWLLQSPRRKWLYYGAMSFLSCGTVILTAEILQLALQIREKLPLSASALRDLLQSYLGYIFNAFWAVTALCFGISALAGLLSWKMRKKPEKSIGG